MAESSKVYDVIVVGGGHAGCEAARAAARMGMETLLLSIHLDSIAHMPCSPSIGGLGKGQLVKEVDALGGVMARVADLSAIQYRLLNTSKGSAVQGSRTQNDKTVYSHTMKAILEGVDRLAIKQTLVEDLLVDSERVMGVRDHLGVEFYAKTVVMTTGTFLSGLVHIGEHRIRAGRAWEMPAYGLAQSLVGLGFSMGRMKTGTPPRLRSSTIDFSRFSEQGGDEELRPFSMFTEKMPLRQVPCFIGRTSPETLEIIRKNIQHSPLYSGAIKGVPARYCPSLEDKVMRFPEKEGHRIILEPEGLETEEIYASGLGNSLPYEIQVRLVRSVPGLEQAQIMRPAYAIEYDFVRPTQLRPTLETRPVSGLFFAGQINGTSGYEEAAAQGLLAGINAALKARGEGPFTLDRSQAYLGVMVDDLVTRGTEEPYRMFTSRAEYRLLLREDNADERLLEFGVNFGLHHPKTLAELKERQGMVKDEVMRLKTVTVTPSDAVNEVLAGVGSKPLSKPSSLDKILKRPGVGYPEVERIEGAPSPLPQEVIRQVVTRVKYEGYVRRQEAEAARFRNLERVRIPEEFDYAGIPGLRAELKEKLKHIRPASLGQASRIPGMTPAALAVLMVWVKRQAG